LERLVTTSEAAQILGLSLQGIHYRIKKDQLKSIKKDGKIFVYVDDEQKYVQSPPKAKIEPIIQNNYKDSQAIIDVKNEQIELLKKSMKWMKKQYISEIFRLEKNQKRIIEVFNSEIKLLQSAFNEMRSIYKPQILQEKKEQEIKKENNEFILVKDFFILMKRYNKTNEEIKIMIFNAIKNGDRRFIYNKVEKRLLILKSDFIDLV
jgi:hypothetical protein